MSNKDKREMPDIKKQILTSDKDRREFERFVVRLTVKFINLENGNKEKGITHDISAKGLGMVANEQVDKNIPLEMWLEIPEPRQEPIHVKGEVAWSQMVDRNTWRVGINFDQVNFLGVSRILRLH